MNKIKNTLFILICVSMTMLACKSKQKGVVNTRDYVKEGFVQATVINHAVDGCTWMLKLNDGTMLEPRNLDEEYRNENLAVWVKYEKVKKAVSICMAGEMVDITAILKRK